MPYFMTHVPLFNLITFNLISYFREIILVTYLNLKDNFNALFLFDETLRKIFMNYISEFVNIDLLIRNISYLIDQNSHGIFVH
jgi:hypothetical protein